MTERPTIDVAAPAGGWPHPWPNVAELARALPGGTWTLVGGLMVQLHTIHAGVGTTRPTNDIDIVLHIETTRGVAEATARALEALGYEFRPAFDPRSGLGHRWIRDDSRVDVVTSTPRPTQGHTHHDTVDVLTADHAPPRTHQRMRGHEMVAIEGGTQALRRTINVRLVIEAGMPSLISVPGPFGALVLKSAAHKTDTRDRDRHLSDAVALLACVDDPFAERESFAGSDASRIRHLADHLPTTHPAWLTLPQRSRQQARDALAILAADPT